MEPYKNLNLYSCIFQIIKQNPMILIVVIFIIAAIVVVTILTSKQKNLSAVQNKRVGNNQMGSARFMNEKEKNKIFKKIEYDPVKWRKNPESRPKEQGMIWGLEVRKKKKYTYLDTSDNNTILIGPPGIGKTNFFLLPQLEFACASGQRLLITDTKGDVYRTMGEVMKEFYGYNLILIDFRNPTREDSFNFMQLVNQYMDLAEVEKNEFKKLKYQALAEKNAKIVAETIINSSGGSQGNNAYFYDTAKGILISTILIISKYGDKEILNEDGTIKEAGTRHIVSVFKVIQEMSEFETKEGEENLTESKFAKLINKLGENDKTRWFAGASTKADIKTASSCFSTALTILTKFIDSEIEQILCFDSKFTIEDFIKNKSAIFVTLPEEDPTKYFLFSLLLNQIYGQLLHIADEDYNGKFDNTVRLFLDEFGTLPKIEGVEAMFTASRSRNVLSVPIIQMFSQLKKYKEGANAIKDSCKNTIFSNFSAISEDAQLLSKAMGKYTTQTGSISKADKKNSISYSMAARDLMTPDEISRLKVGEFILLRTGTYPCRLNIPFYQKWGIKPGGELPVKESFNKPNFINVKTLEDVINKSQKENTLENNKNDKFSEYVIEESTNEVQANIEIEKEKNKNKEQGAFVMNENEVYKEIVSKEENQEYEDMIIAEANKKRAEGKLKDRVNSEINTSIFTIANVEAKN